VTIALPRKRPFDRVMRKVGGPQSTQSAAPAPIEREPGSDDNEGESDADLN
jgi:hypothetical protein